MCTKCCKGNKECCEKSSEGHDEQLLSKIKDILKLSDEDVELIRKKINELYKKLYGGEE